jgi:hypothetical protein
VKNLMTLLIPGCGQYNARGGRSNNGFGHFPSHLSWSPIPSVSEKEFVSRIKFVYHLNCSSRCFYFHPYFIAKPARGSCRTNIYIGFRNQHHDATPQVGGSDCVNITRHRTSSASCIPI